MSLKDDVGEFVHTILSSHKPKSVRDKKIIHESVHGTNIFYRHEIVLLDSPLLQRLKGIGQTGLAYQTYPSSTHSRFAHTLGVMSVVALMIQSINQKKEEPIIEGDPKTGDVADLRTAALLHDCGHGPFSHVSERVFEHFDGMRTLKREDRFAKCSGHEILSYLIVTSDAFRDYFKRILTPYDTDINLDNVADYIIGRSDNKDKLFLARLINGPFDADKLDYIARDALFSGLSLVVDIDRLLFNLDIRDTEDGRDLICESPVPLEQIMFSKLMLTSSMYHHHKVRATEGMIQNLLEYIHRETVDISGITIKKESDFLYLSDADFINRVARKNQNHYVAKTINALLNRDLLRRCVALCRKTIEGYDEFKLNKIFRITEKPDAILELQQEIADRANRDIGSKYQMSKYDIYVSLPEVEIFEENAETRVRQDYSADAGDMSKTGLPTWVLGWMRSYNDKRWTGYIFGPPSQQQAVCDAAAPVLEDQFDIKINCEENMKCCKIC